MRKILTILLSLSLLSACGKEDVDEASADLPVNEEEARTIYIVKTDNDIRELRSSLDELNALIYNGIENEEEILDIGNEVMSLMTSTNDQSYILGYSDSLDFQGTSNAFDEISPIVDFIYEEYSQLSLKFNEKNIENIKANLFKLEKAVENLESQWEYEN